MKKKSIVTILLWRDSVFKPAVFIIGRVKSVTPCLGAERGLATQKSKVFCLPSGFLKCGFDRVLSCQITAERNADLIDQTSAAIKYHKGQQEDKTDNETSNQVADISRDIFNKKLQDTFKSITPAVIESITIGDVKKYLEEEAAKEEEKEKAKEKKIPSSLTESKK